MWIPKWLGEIYSKLYSSFELELFTFQQAREKLIIQENKLAVAFSKLHAKRGLLIFKPGKPRAYRLLDPENFLLLASENIRNVEKIPQERYLQLICSCHRQVSKSFETCSFAVYGSVARGTATSTSDIDILVISEDFQGSLGSRIEKLNEVEAFFQEELRWLSHRKIYTSLSFYPLKKEEAKRLPSIFLDLTEEAVILHDENQFLERLLVTFKAKLLQQGAKRIFIDKKHWYWDLKPDYKFGEKVEIA